jgi:hypothetical protein
MPPEELPDEPPEELPDELAEELPDELPLELLDASTTAPPSEGRSFRLP